MMQAVKEDWWGNINTNPGDTFIWEGYEPYCITEEIIVEPDPEPTTPVINPNTKINIYFDDSGSMNDVLDYLNAMRTGKLKTELVQYYGSEQAYLDNVKIIDFSQIGIWERFFQVIHHGMANNTVTIIFQNEADDSERPEQAYYTYPWSNSQQPTSAYQTDLSSVRTKLNTVNDSFRAIIMHVKEYSGYPNTFKNFLQNIEAGTNNYTGTNSIADIPEISIQYDIEDPSVVAVSNDYFSDVTIAALINAGYDI